MARLEALDKRLTLAAGAAKSHLEEAMADHLLAEAVLRATYFAQPFEGNN